MEKEKREKLMDKYKEFEYIDIDTLRKKFPLPSHLHEVGISNLAEIFVCYDLGYIPYSSLRDLSSYEHDLFAMKCLRGFYLGEDTLIDELDEDVNQRYAYDLQLPLRAKNALKNAGILTSKQFFELIRKPDSYNELLKINNLGERSVRIIYRNAMIIVECNDKRKNDEKNIIEEDNDKTFLEYLYAELMKLKEESARIDNQIGIILKKIDEKTMSDSKGGINK